MTELLVLYRNGDAEAKVTAMRAQTLAAVNGVQVFVEGANLQGREYCDPNVIIGVCTTDIHHDSYEIASTEDFETELREIQIALATWPKELQRHGSALCLLVLGMTSLQAQKKMVAA